MLAALTTACAPLVPQIPPPLDTEARSQDGGKSQTGPTRRELRVETAPTAPAAAEPSAGPVVEKAQLNDPVVAAVNLQQVALPTLIQLVYSEVLKKSVNLHPSVIQRTELVTFRTGAGQTAGQVEQAMRLLLKSHGLSVLDVGGLVRVVPDNAALGDLPSVRFGAASADTPLPLRPVYHLVTLQAVRQVDVTIWLRTMFGDRVTVLEDAGRNAVLLRGNPDNVKAALEAIEALDQPAMKGRASMALKPAYWSADELARRLAEVMAAEGYVVHPIGNAITPGASRAPVILLPVSALNSIYVFTSSDAVAAHVANWARQLDRPSEGGIGKNFFTYPVRHKDAESLAQTLNQILSGVAAPSAAAQPAQAGAATAAAPAAASRGGAVVVDKSTNTLIFQAKPDEFAQITSLLDTLDRPAKSALIEVTVAELTLSNNREIGVDLLTSHLEAAGGYKVGTTNGGSSAASLNVSVFNGLNLPRVAISALASDNRATILSSPRLMARNGETATIQVGSEVPIITQQQTAPVAGTNSTGLLQTVQYRNTGVVLKIKPVIHSGDQIDIDVQQEVSEAGKTDTGVNTTPTFDTRKVETKLTLRNGSTVLLAGLIRNSGRQNKGGVPFLKDIPLIGQMFGRTVDTDTRTELIILITPYIANDTHDAEAITEAFRKSLGPWARSVKSAVPATPPGPQ